MIIKTFYHLKNAGFDQQYEQAFKEMDIEKLHI